MAGNMLLLHAKGDKAFRRLLPHTEGMLRMRITCCRLQDLRDDERVRMQLNAALNAMHGAGPAAGAAPPQAAFGAAPAAAPHPSQPAAAPAEAPPGAHAVPHPPVTASWCRFPRQTPCSSPILRSS